MTQQPTNTQELANRCEELYDHEYDKQYAEYKRLFKTATQAQLFNNADSVAVAKVVKYLDNFYKHTLNKTLARHAKELKSVWTQRID